LFDTWFHFVGSLTTAFTTVELWAVKTGGNFLVLHQILPSLLCVPCPHNILGIVMWKR